jgi:hypothetical protein
MIRGDLTVNWSWGGRVLARGAMTKSGECSMKLVGDPGTKFTLTQS